MNDSIVKSQGNQLASTQNETSTAMAMAQAKAEIEASMMFALANPRDMDVARASLKRECQRPAFAYKAVKNRPLGGNKSVDMETIHFATEAAKAFKNIRIEAYETYDSPEKIKFLAKVTDLESNLSFNQEVSVNKTVERKSLKKGEEPISIRTTSKGDTNYILPATEDDLLAKTNARISKAWRNLIKKVLPADFFDECLEECKRTNRSEVKRDPDGAKKRLIDGFAELNVPIDELKGFVGHSLDTLSTKEIEGLRNVFTAVKSGEESWSEILEYKRQDRKDTENAKDSNGATKSKVDQIKAKIKGKAQPEREETVDPNTGEVFEKDK